MKAKKKKGIFYAHFFHSGSRCALFFLSPIFVSFVVQSSSRRRLFPTPANQVSENGRNTAPLLLALRSAAHRTASRGHTLKCVLSLEREGIRLVRNAVLAFPHLYSGRDESSFCKIADAFVLLNHRPPPLYS